MIIKMWLSVLPVCGCVFPASFFNNNEYKFTQTKRQGFTVRKPHKSEKYRFKKWN